MSKKEEPVDILLDALVWMRRKAKRHEAVDDLVDVLLKMRRTVKERGAKTKRFAKKHANRKSLVTKKGKRR